MRETFVLGPLTKDGNITLLIRPKFHTPGTFHIDDLVRYGIFCVEKAVQQIESKKLKPQIACIYDRTGMTNQNKDGQVVKLALRMATALQDFYCERLGDFYVIGANTMFWIGHKLIKPFLAQKTRDKIKLINKLEELEQFYDKDHIYKEHGGTLEYEYDPHKMWGLPKEGEEESKE